jgi:hypothetical protein
MEGAMKSEELIGKRTLAMIPIFDQRIFQEVTIHGVESGGFWLECPNYSRIVLSKLNVPAIKTPLFFVPYSEIKFLLHSLEKLELSEEKFGVST